MLGDSSQIDCDRPCAAWIASLEPTWARRIQTKVQWTFVPPSRFAMDGEPWSCKRSRTAQRGMSRTINLTAIASCSNPES